jgi:hypothetical protein
MMVTMAVIRTREDLATTIAAMNYRDLKQVGLELSEMIDAEVRPKIETPEDFATALSDWADAVLEPA